VRHAQHGGTGDQHATEQNESCHSAVAARPQSGRLSHRRLVRLIRLGPSYAPLQRHERILSDASILSRATRPIGLSAPPLGQPLLAAGDWPFAATRTAAPSEAHGAACDRCFWNDGARGTAQLATPGHLETHRLGRHEGIESIRRSNDRRPRPRFCLDEGGQCRWVRVRLMPSSPRGMAASIGAPSSSGYVLEVTQAKRC
jgi:hypothetical protein